jgi:hypothetical protein
LCVACERPCKIEIEGKSLKLIFADGEVFTHSE